MHHEKTIVEVLEEAIQSVKSGWTQGALARDVIEKEVAVTDESACSWCITGAIYRSIKYVPRFWWTAREDYNEFRKEKRKSASRILDVLTDLAEGAKLGLPAWNDHVSRTREDVLVLLNQALEQERAKS